MFLGGWVDSGEYVWWEVAGGDVDPGIDTWAQGGGANWPLVGRDLEPIWEGGVFGAMAARSGRGTLFRMSLVW